MLVVREGSAGTQDAPDFRERGCLVRDAAQHDDGDDGIYAAVFGRDALGCSGPHRHWHGGRGGAVQGEASSEVVIGSSASMWVTAGGYSANADPAPRTDLDDRPLQTGQHAAAVFAVAPRRFIRPTARA